MSVTTKAVRCVHREDAEKPAPERIDQPYRMALALQEDNPRPFRKSFLRLYLCIFAGYLCSATNGFDSNTFGGLPAMPSFMDYFGPCADTYGRRVGMALGSTICVIGAVLQTVAPTIGMLMGGRFVLGIGAAVVQSAGPAHVSSWEQLFPPSWSMASAYTWTSGQWYGVFPSPSKDCRPLFCSSWYGFSRWYVAHNRIDDARHVLIKYHGDGDPQSKVVGLEIDEMCEVINQEGADQRFWDIRDLFNTTAARHRTFLVTCIAWFAQLDLPPTSYYFPLMVKTAGVSDSQTQLLLNAIQTPIMMISALCGLYFIHSFGRRKLLMMSSICMTVCLCIMTACTAHQEGKPLVGGAGIAFLYLFLVVFAFAWIPMQSLYPSEVLAYNSRAKGLAFMNLMLNIANVLNTYIPPIGISRCGWRFYFMYISWDAFGVLVVCLCFVETKGWNLEEIEHLFETRHPVKESLRRTN